MPDQINSEDGQTYRFISDPKHKENLSGRVRAACITCRRKKIKCSGEVPCTTCREKGVVCEGLTERKRPGAKSDYRLSSDVPPDVGRSSSATSSETHEADSLQRTSHSGLSIRTGMPPDAPQRPPLKTTDTISSDSGYSSGNQSNCHESISGFKLTFESFNSTLGAYDGSNISPTNTKFQDWTSAPRRHTSSYDGSDRPNRTQSLPTASSTEALDMTDSSDWNTGWWLDNTSNPVTPTNLLSTARVLEEQAQSLRILASRQNTSMVDNHGGQTATLSMSSDTSDAFNVSLHPQDRFHEMASLFTDGSPRKGSNTIGRDFSPYSGLNSSYSTVYGDQELPESQYQALHLADVRIVDPATPDLHQTQNIGADTGSCCRRSQERGASDLNHLRNHQANEPGQFGFPAFFGPLDRHP